MFRESLKQDTRRTITLPLLALVVCLLVVAGVAATPSVAVRQSLAAATASQDPSAVEASLALNRSTRRVIQQVLRNEGFDPGTPDGFFGPRTRAAIRDWQHSRGAPPTGYLNGAAAELLRATAVQFSSSPPALVPSTTTPPAALEGLFWQSIMNSTNPAEFQAYLDQFPKGLFRSLAEVRLAPLLTPTDEHRDNNSQVADIMYALTSQLVLMAVGVFAIVGSIIAARSQRLQRTPWLFGSLIFFALSAAFGYVLQGAIIGRLNDGTFAPYGFLSAVGVVQLLLFITAAVALIVFIRSNL